jgi:hypothetical protein
MLRLPRQRNASERWQRLQRRVEVEAVATTDAAHAVAAELEALRANSIGSSVSTDDDRDNELKLARKAARE